MVAERVEHHVCPVDFEEQHVWPHVNPANPRLGAPQGLEVLWVFCNLLHFLGDPVQKSAVLAMDPEVVQKGVGENPPVGRHLQAAENLSNHVLGLGAPEPALTVVFLALPDGLEERLRGLPIGVHDPPAL